MTKKKSRVVRVDATAWQRIEEQLKRVADHNDHTDRRISRLEDEANSRLADKQPGADEPASSVIDGMATARHKTARRHATPGGPNFPDDIYPPGCGPLQLVWSLDQLTDHTVIGWQGDSFHHFPSRAAAVSWLLGIAQRIINDKPPA